MSVHTYFQNGTCDLAGLAGYLDNLDDVRRVAEATTLNAGEQAQLWDAAASAKPLTLGHFVPDNLQPLQPVIHYGKNSLPLFTKFQKVFCKAQADANTPNLWGYNEQLLKAFTGPGYFVTKATQEGDLDHGGVVIDYTDEPTGKAENWPKFIPNNKRLSRFIYNGTKDYMRGVSRHVSIGRASRAGQWMDNWFVLCRQA